MNGDQRCLYGADEEGRVYAPARVSSLTVKNRITAAAATVWKGEPFVGGDGEACVRGLIGSGRRFFPDGDVSQAFAVAPMPESASPVD